MVPHRHSIFFKLNLFFLFAVAALIAFFVMTVRELKLQELQLIEKRVLQDEAQIRKIILEEEGDPQKRFRQRGFRIVEYPDVLKKDLKRIFTHPPSNFPPIVAERMRDGRLKIYRDDENLYFELVGPDHSTMIAAPLDIYRPNWIPLLFGSMIAILIVLYWTMIRSLKPLKTLAEQIRRFGEGQMNVSTRSEKKDEIAFVANQFDSAVKKMRAMKEARTLFMRNIMHELKTPITKGKLSVALMQGGEEEQVLRKAFDRMEQLIQEMAEVEMITSQSLDLTFDRCDLRRLVEDVKGLLFVEEEGKVRFVCRDCAVEADCKMLTIVLKNLIDNAMKYSSDGEVEICCKNGRIEVSNAGEPLGRPFEELIEPFAKGEPGLSAESFGLGLYIVKSILDAHGAQLEYRYKKGRHRFVIKGLKFTL